jgi:hypothetical protein
MDKSSTVVIPRSAEREHGRPTDEVLRWGRCQNSIRSRVSTRRIGDLRIVKLAAIEAMPKK